MRIGVPRELKNHEYRVAITPAGVHELVAAGHGVAIEAGAGDGSSIRDQDFVDAGALINQDVEDLWASSDLILKVKEPLPQEFPRMKPGQVLFTYLHLAASPQVTEALIDGGVTAIAYETVGLADGRLPLLAPMSEVAGRMAPQVGAHFLEREAGGRGVLMGGVSGVRPARVLVLGAGMAGQNAALVAQGMDAQVVLLDTNIDKLRSVDSRHKGRVLTLMSTRRTIDELALESDLIIGSVLIPGARAPRLITAEHIQAMKAGTVLVDIAIDQGGCFETSRMTTHADPTYQVNGVIHYCVGNMPGAVPHTSTHALTNVTLPYVVQLASGIDTAVTTNSALAKGVNVWRGQLVNEAVAEAHSLSWTSLDQLVATGT